MPDLNEAIEAAKSIEAPLVFISHDSRDADLAEAFSKLLRSVSAGMLKCFRSSDKKGIEGIEFGDEWYKKLMEKLEKASDVVCLLTERSLERPWILYETGVAKGKRDTPVHGIALGVPLGRVSAGPFYQFQNSDDSEESLTKLVLQLCRRIANLDPDAGVVTDQVRSFKASVSEIIKSIGNQKPPVKREVVSESAVAKVLEEMKLVVREVSVRSEQRMIEASQSPRRRLSLRRAHPRAIEEMAHMISRGSGYPIGILLIASLFREDLPWLYEIGMEAYRIAKRGHSLAAREALEAFRDAAEFTIHGPFLDEIGIAGREVEGLRELPSAIHHYVMLAKDVAPERISAKRVSPDRPTKSKAERK
jgi:hypothetical protein